MTDKLKLLDHAFYAVYWCTDKSNMYVTMLLSLLLTFIKIDFQHV